MRCCQGKPRDGTFHNNTVKLPKVAYLCMFPPSNLRVFFPKDPLPKRRRSIHEFRIRSPNHWIFGPKTISMKLTFSALKIGNIPKHPIINLPSINFQGVFKLAVFVSGRVKQFYTKKKPTPTMVQRSSFGTSLGQNPLVLIFDKKISSVQALVVTG